ncbi:MAG: oligosaccharide flippase family protein [Sharpea porci]|uniref:oligosaccharide flippase family protein n=1 Tax=Sharpea porci TaxID=2652286 RepID=UPI002409EDF3|nr:MULTISPECIES: oligosaccharide flippase family protein [Coprobacillaceae]MDD6594883.1 oligosaccharide flippase family protein [Catenibacterium mitsuokai]MDD6710469.1 oligosaccharide flippase family protein [Sharpea porci]
MKINQRKAGVILSYLGEIVKIVVNLAYTPIMLRLLGQSEYGLYQLVYSVVSYLSLLSLGFGSSYLRFYSRYRAENDEDGIAKLNGMFMMIFCVISLICIFSGVIMIKNIRSIFGTGLTDAEYSTAKILMGLLIINLAITFPNSVFNCSITAHEKFLFQKLLILLQNLFSPFLTLPLLILGYGSIGMVSVTTVLTLTLLLTNAFYCFKKLRISFCFHGFKIGLLKEMWFFTFFVFLNQIIDQINWSVDKFLLGRLAGTSAVAVYGVGGQINTMYQSFSTSISNVFVPKVNRIVAETNDNNELTKLFTKVGRIQFMVIALILSGFLFFGRAFVSIWAGDGYDTSYSVALLLIVPVTIPLIQNLGIEIQRAKNMHKARSVIYMIIAIANVFISIPLIKIMGPAGAALGTAISLIVGNIFFMNWYYQKRIGLDVIYFWKQIFSFIPALIAPCIVGILLMKYVNITGVVKLGLYAVVYAIVYELSMYFLGMNDDEKALVVGPIKKIIHK